MLLFLVISWKSDCLKGWVAKVFGFLCLYCASSRQGCPPGLMLWLLPARCCCCRLLSCSWRRQSSQCLTSKQKHLGEIFSGFLVKFSLKTETRCLFFPFSRVGQGLAWSYLKVYYNVLNLEFKANIWWRSDNEFEHGSCLKVWLKISE